MSLELKEDTERTTKKKKKKKMSLEFIISGVLQLLFERSVMTLKNKWHNDCAASSATAEAEVAIAVNDNFLAFTVYRCRR